MLNFKKNEEAVSPVIGTILMVAITVILAAVIAAFVFGMSGNIQSSKTVGVSSAINADGNITVTIQGGVDLPSLTKLVYQLDGGSVNDMLQVGGTDEIKVGSQFKLEEDVRGKPLLVMGEFMDGSRAILLDKTF
jgi:flagellin-like protein